MKIVANRLNKKILNTIIGNHQSGFCANRNILDAFLEYNMILENPNKIPTPLWLVFLDQKKTYDRVNHKYLLQTLSLFGFSNHFCDLIGGLYRNQTATISDKGIISESFSLERGVRQGDPLLPLLYIISLEHFLRKVNSSIQGIMLNSVMLKAKAYANDTTIGITLRDWPLLLKSISLYERVSNAEINFNKSKLLQLNGKSNQYTSTPLLSLTYKKMRQLYLLVFQLK